MYDMMSILHVYDMIRILYKTCTETSQIHSKKICENIVVALFSRKQQHHTQALQLISSSAGPENATAKLLSSNAGQDGATAK